MFLVRWRPGAAPIAIAAQLLWAGSAFGQASPPAAEAVPDPATQPQALDPGSPLDPLPDLGVEWPDPEAAEAAATAIPPDGTTPPVASPARLATAATTAPEASRRYSIVIEGLDQLDADKVDAAALRVRFDALSELEKEKGDPAVAAQVDRRARDDADLLAQLLRASGYYDAEVTTRLEQPASGPLRAVLHADPGTIYRFTAVTVTGLDTPGADAAALRESFAVKPGDPVDADRVAAAQAALVAAIGRGGFPFATVADPALTVDHATHEATLALAVVTGGERRFGRILAEGRPPFDAVHIQHIARFRPGELYDAALVEDLRRALVATGLVSSVRIEPRAGAEGQVDLAVRLERAPPRTIAGELGYGTGEGVRAEISWQHRNLIKPEGAVTFRGVLGTREQQLGAILRRGNFRERDQVLTGQIVAAHSKLDAYDARTFSLAGGLERQTNIIWQKTWTWSFGGELLASDERALSTASDETARRTYLIAAVPTSLAYDGSDDLLNPTRGFRLAGRLSPEASLRDGVFGYARAQLDASAYQPVSAGVVVAGRVRFGTIFGAAADRLAPSRRFYAGGGGSVRGYGYQAIGPRDLDNDPLGGRSLAEFSIETRVRFGAFGVVPFVDAGNIYRATLPGFGGIRYGAGLGVRYYTSFGPIRFDVGTPLNRRSGDSRVAVYVSLGQAF